MRIGLISDPHGNAFALGKVLDDLGREPVDTTVCLGDVAVLGPDPAGTIAMIRSRVEITVCGNTDQWLRDRLDHAEVRGAGNERLRNLAAWAMDRISDDDLAWIDALPQTVTIELPASRRLLAFHGSPRSNTEVISALTPDEDLDAMIEDGYAFAAGGHTHIQLVRQLRRNNSVLLNPGSAGYSGAGPDQPGLPLHREVTFAEYAVLDVNQHGYEVTLRRVELPVNEMLDWARGFGLRMFERWAETWRQ
jgi:predicted phosphodiesterase